MDVLIYSFALILFCSYTQSQRNFVPEASLEVLSPSGLRISLPDDNPAWRQVAFHINVNERFRGVEHGHYAEDVYDKTNGRWTLEIPQLRAKEGDVIYYWINVIEDNQGYNARNREYRVGGTSSSPPSPPPGEPDEGNPEDDVEPIPPAPLKKKPKRRN
ncbi:beta-1,3-glucan-binding protein-like isoform X1 [Macrosteles quadrilineatus]|uniref:beta-1,3-glucan-binding protein-like isoform X1 n=1 Tax=Macrosteles quadrilineatus TaxID=74068 RepID=UPI0023E2F55D|nr:beta-1,3-glucan-binding protein-like isoform X1 [Macrosteles quadrilineatus]